MENKVDLLQISNQDLQKLKTSLGIVETLRLLEKYDNGGKGDYTLEKYQKEDIILDDEEIRKIFNL